MKTILILGAGVMQGPVILAAKARSWRTVVVDGDPSAVNAVLADHFEQIDLKDRESLLAFAQALAKNGGLSGVMTAGTDFSSSVAYIAEHIGLPGIPYENALDASDKIRMRRRFQAAGVPSPAFVELRSPPEESWLPPFGFPAVVKPVDNMGARGCRKVDNADELNPAVRAALTFSRSGRVIVERYMDGPEYSIDALIYKGKIIIHGVADRHIFFPPYFIEMGHTLPAALSNESLASVIAVFEEGVRALGLREGAAKGDVKLTSQGPMIGEIAARLSGGYMSGWTYPYATGIALSDAALSIAVGENPFPLTASRDWTSAERAFISIPGKLERVIGLDEVRSLPFVCDVFSRVEPGQRLGFPENNVSKCGNVIAASPDRAQAIAAAEAAARAVLLVLRYPDKETDTFLAASPLLSRENGGRFPPDAYTVDDSLSRSLAELPESSVFLEPSDAIPLIPWRRFQESSSRDYQGREPSSGLRAVELIMGKRFRTAEPNEKVKLGRGFWASFLRGSYQGAAYYIQSRFRG